MIPTTAPLDFLPLWCMRGGGGGVGLLLASLIASVGRLLVARVLCCAQDGVDLMLCTGRLPSGCGPSSSSARTGQRMPSPTCPRRSSRRTPPWAISRWSPRWAVTKTTVLHGFRVLGLGFGFGYNPKHQFLGRFALKPYPEPLPLNPILKPSSAPVLKPYPGSMSLIPD